MIAVKVAAGRAPKGWLGVQKPGTYLLGAPPPPDRDTCASVSECFRDEAGQGRLSQETPPPSISTRGIAIGWGAGTRKPRTPVAIDDATGPSA